MTKTFKVLLSQDPSLVLSEKALRAWGAAEEIEFEFTQGLPETLSSLGNDVHAVRCSLAESLVYLPSCPVVPMKASQLGTADQFLPSRGRWTPELMIEKALLRGLVQHAQHLDLKESAYLIGEGAELRVIAAAALGLGFKHICLVGENEEDLIEQDQILRRMFVGAQIKMLPTHALTLQTVGASLLINSLPLSTREDLAADLAYFNFMRRGGVIVDLQDLRTNSDLLEEARRAGLRTLTAPTVFALRDQFFLESLGLSLGPSEVKSLALAWQSAVS